MSTLDVKETARPAKNGRYGALWHQARDLYKTPEYAVQPNYNPGYFALSAFTPIKSQKV